jgi:hypothetical protein
MLQLSMSLEALAMVFGHMRSGTGGGQQHGLRVAPSGGLSLTEDTWGLRGPHCLLDSPIKEDGSQGSVSRHSACRRT